MESRLRAKPAGIYPGWKPGFAHGFPLRRLEWVLSRRTPVAGFSRLTPSPPVSRFPSPAAARPGPGQGRSRAWKPPGCAGGLVAWPPCPAEGNRARDALRPPRFLSLLPPPPPASLPQLRPRPAGSRGPPVRSSPARSPPIIRSARAAGWPPPWTRPPVASRVPYPQHAASGGMAAAVDAFNVLCAVT